MQKMQPVPLTFDMVYNMMGEIPPTVPELRRFLGEQLEKSWLRDSDQMNLDDLKFMMCSKLYLFSAVKSQDEVVVEIPASKGCSKCRFSLRGCSACVRNFEPLAKSRKRARK
jgi:hypothetical protein